MDTVDVRQRGDEELSNEDSSLNVIVPRSNFSCNGRITGYMVSLKQEVELIQDNGEIKCSFPSILVWHPLNTDQTVYHIINTYTLSTSNRMGNYYFADISFTGNDRFEVQSGDVIGYQYRSSPCYTVWSNEVDDYTSYSIDDINDDTINITDSSVIANRNLQPLIQVAFGMYDTCSYS